MGQLDLISLFRVLNGKGFREIVTDGKCAGQPINRGFHRRSKWIKRINHEIDTDFSNYETAGP